MNKKSQITMFFLLGIVIVIIFGFLFYVTQSTTKEKLEAQVDMATTDLLETTAIKYYITTCLDQATKEALELISKQGGFIYESQGGIEWDIPYVSYDKANISYQIYSYNPIVEEPYLYPCYTPDSGKPDSRIGENCYKSYNHQKKNYNFGSEGRTINRETPDLCKENILGPTSDYGCYCSSCLYSVQEQLEEYISQKTEDCVNLSIFKGYDITEGRITANATMGNDDVSVLLNYPVVIRVKGYQPVTRILNFYSAQPVRLKSIYSLVFGLGKAGILQKDRTNASFSIEDDAYGIAYDLKPPLEYIDVIRREMPPFNTTVIIINDTSENHKLAGKSFMFQFARENRYPALDYYNPDNCYNEFTNEYYHVCVPVNDTITLEPVAFDPDEDDLQYIYSGWLTDGLNYWQDSSLYLNNNPDICRYPGIKYSNRCANYTTQESDKGPHNITIEVIDKEGLKDWQLIKIFVNDKPQPEIKTGFGGCKDASGNFIEFAAIKNSMYILEGHCGDTSSALYQFEWSFGDIENNVRCFHNITKQFSSSTTVRLKVTDSMGYSGYSPEYSLNVYDDNDHDNYCSLLNDCEDSNADVYPGATEICDGIDNNCDGSAAGEQDSDVDGYRVCNGDCDDDKPNVNPGGSELSHCADGLDNDCDGFTDSDDSKCP